MEVRVNGRLIQREGDPVEPADFHDSGVSTVRANGQPIAIVGQLTTGHGDFPPTPAITGSPDVSVTGIPVVREGDPYAPHTDGKTVHPGFAAPL